MRLPFLASFIVFIIWLFYEISKSRKVTEREEKQFWERERAANRTRRKSLDGLNYISIPLEQLPMNMDGGQDDIKECLDVIRTLAQQTIVNLTGYSNTDLKLMYGAPNLTVLMEYDQNYLLLARTLQKWASLLYDRGDIAQAKQVLQFAVSTNTDVSGSYKLLSAIYRAEGTPEKIAGLLETAQSLNSAMKPAIVRILQESDPSDD